MASGLLIDYLGAGVAASRPASPTLHTGALGLYYATDTNVLSLWDGLTWENAAASSQPLDATLTALAALTIAANSLTIGTGADAFSQVSFAANTFPARASSGDLVAKAITDFGLSLIDDSTASAARQTLAISQAIGIACSDETTALTTGTAKATFRMPHAFTLTAVRASVTTAPTGAVLTVDINEGGVSILSTKLTIDATEKTSTTAAIPAVISDSALADDAEITIDIDTIGSTIAGTGLKVWLIGYIP